jgi:hypothetical protein
MNKTINLPDLESLDCKEFEQKVYTLIIEAYGKRNLHEYYLIIKLMKCYCNERKEIIKNALIIINNLFLVEQRRCYKPIESKSDELYANEILKSICM